MNYAEFFGKLNEMPGGYKHNTDAENFRLLHLVDFAITHGKRLYEQLNQLDKQGPVWDGDVISKSDRTELLSIGAAVKVLVKGEDGFQACTYLGHQILTIIETIYPELKYSDDSSESPVRIALRKLSGTAKADQLSREMAKKCSKSMHEIQLEIQRAIENKDIFVQNDWTLTLDPNSK
jgi:hypothetical protein